jgi:hypothetical protein
MDGLGLGLGLLGGEVGKEEAMDLRDGGGALGTLFDDNNSVRFGLLIRFKRGLDLDLERVRLLDSVEEDSKEVSMDAIVFCL